MDSELANHFVAGSTNFAPTLLIRFFVDHVVDFLAVDVVAYLQKIIADFHNVGGMAFPVLCFVYVPFLVTLIIILTASVGSGETATSTEQEKEKTPQTSKQQAAESSESQAKPLLDRASRFLDALDNGQSGGRSIFFSRERRKGGGDSDTDANVSGGAGASGESVGSGGSGGGSVGLKTELLEELQDILAENERRFFEDSDCDGDQLFSSSELHIGLFFFAILLVGAGLGGIAWKSTSSEGFTAWKW